MRFIRKIIDRAGGPAISIVVHVIIVAVLLKVVVFRTLEPEREIEVQVIDVEESPELNQKPQTIDDLPSDDSLIEPEEPEIALDAPIENLPSPSIDLSGLAISTDQSPIIMKGLFAGRSKSGRAELLKKFAGEYSEDIEASVLLALRWLALQQNENGYWGEISKFNQNWHTKKWASAMKQEQRATRLTALCLLAFLSHGETPQSEEFGKNVQLAIEYLKNQQNPQTGMFVPLAQNRPVKGGEDLGVYAHAQATYALAEAYALTRAPSLRRVLERALKVIIDGQLESGAWGNWYEQKISDSSASSWQIQALIAARAAGIDIAKLQEAMEKAKAGIEYLYQDEGAWYYRKGEPLKTWSDGGPIMSGAMVFSLQLLGEKNDNKVLAGLRYMNDFGVSKWEKAWKNPINKSLPAPYEWYYNTQAVFLRAGSRWKSWNDAFAPMLITNQNKAGYWRGPTQNEGEETIYSTSLCALALQVYYRILPSFNFSEKPLPKVIFEDDVIIQISDR